MSRLKVLVVDDSRLARSILVRALQQARCEVVGLASNGKEAVEMYNRLKPDLVTMDLKMPEMDGLHALLAIREQDKEASVIVVSSAGDKEKVIECIRSGAKHYILKPFTKETVLEALERVFPEAFEEEDIMD